MIPALYGALAAAGLVTFLAPTLDWSVVPWDTPREDAIRHRGEPSHAPSPTPASDVSPELSLVVARDGGPARPLNGNPRLRQDDVVRFVVSTPEPGYALVVNLDASGAYTRYFPARAPWSAPIEAGSRQVLPGSVVLDGVQGFERIFLLLSSTPLDDAIVREANLAAYRRAAGRIDGLLEIDLPGAHIVSLLIEKEGP